MSSPVYGGTVGADFDKTCPSGTYISHIYGTQAGGVVSIAAQCTDGTNLGSSGGSGGEGRGPGDCQGGIDGVNVISSSSTIGRIGQTCNGQPNIPVGTGSIPNPTADTFACPEGQKVKGIRGKAASTVNSIQVFCDSPGWSAPPAATPPTAFVSGSPLSTMAAPTAFVSGSPLSTMAAPTSSMSGSPLSTMAAPTSSMSGSPLSTTTTAPSAILEPDDDMSSSPLSAVQSQYSRSPSSTIGPSAAPTSSGPTTCVADGELHTTPNGLDCCSGEGIDEEGKCKAKGMSTGVIIGIVVFMLLILAMIGYAMSRRAAKPAVPVVPKAPAFK